MKKLTKQAYYLYHVFALFSNCDGKFFGKKILQHNLPGGHSIKLSILDKGDFMDIFFRKVINKLLSSFGYEIKKKKERKIPKSWENFKNNSRQYRGPISYHNFNYSVNISLKNHYLFTETPKVACSTIKATLWQMELGDPEFNTFYRGTYHERNFSPLLKPSQAGDLGFIINNDKFYKFCFCRNPYTRILSAYLNKIKSNKITKRNILISLGKNSDNLDYDIPFSTFVEAICDQSISDMDPHWRVQYYQTFQENIEYDYIGKFENFNEEFDYVLSKISKDHTKYKINARSHATNAKQMILDYYDDTTIKLVQEKFCKDFQYFGYPMDI